MNTLVNVIEWSLHTSLQRRSDHLGIIMDVNVADVISLKRIK
jgi:hypothetical protein